MKTPVSDNSAPAFFHSNIGLASDTQQSLKEECRIKGSSTTKNDLNKENYNHHIPTANSQSYFTTINDFDSIPANNAGPQHHHPLVRNSGAHTDRAGPPSSS